MKKIIIISVIVIVIAVIGFFAFRPSNGNENGIKLVEVIKGNIVDKALAVGQLEPRQEIQVKSKISGIVKTLHVEVGQDVTKRLSQLLLIQHRWSMPKPNVTLNWPR